MLAMLGDLPSEETKRAHILLVEDEVLIRALLAEELRGHGLVVAEAVNADEAWAILQTGLPVDLLISDVTMPGSMTGTELVRRARARDPQLKAIIMSGNPGPNNIAELGTFLPKPYRLEAASRLALKALGLKGK